MRYFLAYSLGLLLVFVNHASADTPANCTFEDIVGEWVISESARVFSSSVDCSVIKPVVRDVTINLQHPDVAVDQFGNVGTWTIIYNQGFEITISGRTYFAFSYYIQINDTVTSYCDRTLPGWSHDVTIRHWACYQARKTVPQRPKISPALDKSQLVRQYRPNSLYVQQINAVQSSWHAKTYPELHGVSIEDLVKRSGGLSSRIPDMPKPAEPTPEQKAKVALLPENWDWRDINGVNYVTPVRDQQSCGSCYAFASVGMIESRLQILTAKQVEVVLSPQDIVSCTSYAQGCAGGFNYLIAGKYGMDFGFVEEDCNTYNGTDDVCRTNSSCTRYYVSSYDYVGGYYGGCNEQAMIIALIEHGPLAVSYNVEEDFSFYDGGIYHHTGLQDAFNPFYAVNHGVLVVGYGVEPSTREKFWIVKNSWGATWGEEGYFRIRRGTNEVGIESIAMDAIPIPF